LDYNFEIYKILIAKYIYNLNDYLKIEILYDKRPIEISSFWQKCTVVILIMLLFWNKPIIIDEPEAHLDSSLIANYLVDLIKQRKKERQIIFATHNANFVINWDAEQIYILENNDNKTSFTQTTIENLEKRQKLLNLEWWKEAFWLRWKKYNWKY
jgi:predicted ATP-dependent endonuclease of OLD family